MKLIQLTVLMVLSVFWGVLTAEPQPFISKAVTQDKQSTLTPKRALELLKEGNQRFINNQMREYNFVKEMKTTTKKGQHPVAFILSCIDSRSIPDILFDQGLGNIFVSRVAGNVVDEDILGSMEFATKLAGARLVVVMGHTHCGAVIGACTTKGNTDLKNLNALLLKIKPAVLDIKKESHDFNCDSIKIIDQITKQNVINQLQYIHNRSQAIASMEKNKKIYLVGAIHDIKTGNVEFFDRFGREL